MSSRQIRKIQQQRELEQAKLREAAEAGSEEEEDDLYPPVKAGLFSSFAALQDNGDSDGDEDDDNEETTAAQIDNKTGVNPDTARPSAPSKKGKKSKKNKKAKAKIQEPNKAQKPETNNDGDDIDAALRELNIKAEKSGTVAQTEVPEMDLEYDRVCTLLGINNQYLKVANEMRNLFGRTAVENNDDAGGPVPRGGRRRQRAAQQQVDLETALKGHHAPGKGLSELTLRRNIFIQGKDDWPRATTGGLTMEVVDDMQAIDGTVEFRFVHDQAYEAVQNQFRVFVEIGEPQNLISLLQRNPYHVSLLLQVSKIAKDQSDHSLSNDLVERALFTFARASTSLFSTKLSQGKARVDFARPENRELWLAGYHYIKSLSMKGTYRTALEWAKLLLSLDLEDDPYCMKFVLHHLALRAHQFEWLLEASSSSIFNDRRPFIKELQLPSVALAHMHLKHGAECRDVLCKSIKRLPYLFCQLFKELNLDDAPASIWGILPRGNAEELFTSIYIRQTKDLWNTPEATALLVEVAHAVGKSDPSSIIGISDNCIDLDVARFVYLDNTPALMSLVPSFLLHRIPNSDSDPLPPDAEKNIFSYPSQRMPFTTGVLGRAADSELEGHFDPIAALRRLIPGWTGPVAEGEGGDAVERTGLRELMERDMEREIRAGEAEGGGELGAAELENIGSVRRLYRFLFGTRPADSLGAGEREGGDIEGVNEGLDDHSEDDSESDHFEDAQASHNP